MRFRNIFLSFFALVFATYLFVGLQPAGATDYEISASLEIPQINLMTDVTPLTIEGSELKTPDSIVGSYQRFRSTTLLIGHSTTVFQNLHQVKIDDEIIYDDTKYSVKSVDILEKSAIDMSDLLKKSEKETVVLMTCAGERITKNDFTERLIIKAEAI